MKMKKVFLVTSTLAMTTAFMSGCAARMFEKELNVVFMHEGEVVDSGTVTQFKNYKSPTIGKEYIPTDFRFLGWTCYKQLDFKDPVHFKSQYIGAGKMVHYMDVKKFAKGDTVVCDSLMLHKDDIPKVYHYAVVAWYDNSKSGLTSSMIKTYENNVKEYLISEGVTEEDANTVLFRGYSGQVGTTTGQIIDDDDVDIMLGWGSLTNITTTGNFKEEDILQTDSLSIKGNNRTVHRLTDTDSCKTVYDYIVSKASKDFLE